MGSHSSGSSTKMSHSIWPTSKPTRTAWWNFATKCKNISASMVDCHLMDLKLEAQRLRGFASGPPSDVMRAEVLSALNSKFQGIQAVAAEVLGAWGDEASKGAL